MDEKPDYKYLYLLAQEVLEGRRKQIAELKEEINRRDEMIKELRWTISSLRGTTPAWQ